MTMIIDRIAVFGGGIAVQHRMAIRENILSSDRPHFKI